MLHIWMIGGQVVQLGQDIVSFRDTIPRIVPTRRVWQAEHAQSGCNGEESLESGKSQPTCSFHVFFSHVLERQLREPYPMGNLQEI
jgi:hypothetical protein